LFRPTVSVLPGQSTATALGDLLESKDATLKCARKLAVKPHDPK